jgi:hypothetical protein
MSGKYKIAIKDYDGEVTTHGIRVNTLTAANFDAQDTLMDAYKAGIDGITLGQDQHSSKENYAFHSQDPASDEHAQRELKWLIRYKDNVTGKWFSVELGTADPEQTDPNSRSRAHIGDGGVVDAYITAFEGYALSPDGNSCTVMDMLLVGRNT